MRLVMDTDVIVAALRSNLGASRQLLVAGLKRRVTLLVSVPLMVEYEAVLTRADHLAASGLSAEEMNAVLDSLAAVAEPVRLSFLWRPMLADPDDDMVLETAANGQADWIVTFNQRDFSKAGTILACSVGLPSQVLGELRRKR
jgi:putative PIN family toxin of toxin-antitoxin system